MCVETLNMYKRERTSEFTHTIPQRRKTPSFSSSLLDSIYRSIDESDGQVLQDPSFCQSMQKQNKKQSNSVFKQNSPQNRMSDFDRNIIIEEWIEKQNTRNHSRSSVHFNSSSSCSNSSSGGGTFSSSWSDTDQKQNRSGKHPHFDSRNAENHQKKASQAQANGFSKTKLRALKIYGELKKVKQPISPGGRITSFLNSIFSSGNVKKAKMCYVGAVEDVSFERKSKSACSSASSYSRSCMMSKTNSGSRTPKSINSMKRSVRFYPVSVILGEDSKPCGHKCIDDPKLMPLPLSLQLPTVQDVLKRPNLKEKDYISGYKKYMAKSGFGTSGLKKNVYQVEEDDDDESDYAESYASSDLFELDHLIGVGRYREELPVYETTSLKKNQAIANGLML